MAGLALPYRRMGQPSIAPAGDKRVALVGTSLVQHNTKAIGGGICHWSRGWMTWAQVLDPRMRYDVWLDAADPNGRGFSGANQGVSGQTCAQILARLDRVIAMRPAIAILDMGTNDMGAETASFVHEARMTAAERLRRSGILVLLLPILSRGTETYAVLAGATRVSWTAATAVRRKAQWVNQASRHYADATPGVIFCDWNESWIDPASANGEPYAGYSDDGTHFSVVGAFAVARKIVETLGAILPPAQPLLCTPEDRFDAADNPLGNLVPNALMAGTAGTTGTAVTGTVADQMRVERSTGSASTGTAQVLPRNPRGRWQRLSIAAAGTGVETFLIRPSASELAFPAIADAWWQATCDVQLSAHSGWRGCELRANLYAGATASAAMIGLERYESGGTRAPMPSEAWSGTIRTPPFQLPAGVDRARLRLEVAVDGTSGGTATVDAACLALRQVPDPRPMWRL